MTTQLYIGKDIKIEAPKKGPYIRLLDRITKVPRGARIFNPKEDRLNPFNNLDYRAICDFVDIIDALFVGKGEGTLTKDTGLDYIAERLEAEPKSLADLIPEPDKKSTTGHIWAYGKIRRLLRSPVLSQMLSGGASFPLKSGSVILVRADRAELGDFDTLAVGLFLMMLYRGQVVVDDLGFYGRDMHTALIREDRLIAGVSHLDQLNRKAPELRDAVMLIPEKIPQGARYRDAVELAEAAGLQPDHLREENEYNEAIRGAMG